MGSEKLQEKQRFHRADNAWIKSGRTNLVWKSEGGWKIHVVGTGKAKAPTVIST